MYGFHNRGGQSLPEWAERLKEYYWKIRVEGRDKVKKRRYYRYVKKERIRLAEQGIDQNLIKAVCRYLASFNSQSGNKMTQLMTNNLKQLTLDF